MRRLALAVLVLAGCGGHAAGPASTPGPPAAGRQPSQVERLQAALDRRARAIERGPARRLGVHSVELGLTAIHGDRIDVDFGYRVRGVRGVFGGARRLRIRGGRVLRERPRHELAPWEAGHFARTATRHFVLLAPAGIDTAAGGLDTALEDGYARMHEILAAGRLRRRYLVVVARDPGQARALTARIRGLASLTAITDTQVDQAGPAKRVRSVRSQRLLVLWSSFSTATPDQRRIVVTHELTHAALAPDTSGRTPAWLVEGIALYVSGDRRIAAAPLRALLRPDAIARLSGDRQADAYGTASAAAFAIAERYGRGKLVALFEAYNEESLHGSGARLTDRALRHVLGISLAGLQADLL